MIWLTECFRSSEMGAVLHSKELCFSIKTCLHLTIHYRRWPCFYYFSTSCRMPRIWPYFQYYVYPMYDAKIMPRFPLFCPCLEWHSKYSPTSCMFLWIWPPVYIIVPTLCIRIRHTLPIGLSTPSVFSRIWLPVSIILSNPSKKKKKGCQLILRSSHGDSFRQDVFKADTLPLSHIINLADRPGKNKCMNIPRGVRMAPTHLSFRCVVL